MIISSVRLSWFRGSAESSELSTAERSVVVFGANGAGKSCFVDAVEYTLRGGRIRHLAHEYSGRNQEKAVLNTHRPSDSKAWIEIELSDRTEIRVDIPEAGVPTIHRQGACAFDELDCARTVLRQDEVSEFIHSTKGEKYSVLLPLLGLAHLETAAENFRQLGKVVRRRSGAAEASSAQRAAMSALSRIVQDESPTAEGVITALCSSFGDQEHDHSIEACADRVGLRLEQRLRDSSAQTLRQAALQKLGGVDVRAAVKEVREAASRLATVADEATRARMNVLRSAKAFLERGGHLDFLECPACGTALRTGSMREHVDAELASLEEAEQHATDFRRAKDKFRRTASLVATACQSQEIQAWASESEDDRVPEAVDAAAAFELPQEGFDEGEVARAEELLGKAVATAAAAGSFLPTPATELAQAKERLQAARNLLAAERRVADSRTADRLANRIAEVESALRQEIHDQSRDVIANISKDIQRFWGILHPGEPIEDVRLHVPEESDKAIDIALKFYGKDLGSPRLTLSEGYRNSLGLCVFLAMASRYGSGDTPIVLDDVIVSLDRGHRGMVAELLEREFGRRQIILFTHDRDWFADLRHQLGAAQWRFRELLPYATPQEGIRWAERTGSLTDARRYLDLRADTAANEARKVMDVELAIHCERLELSLPFARGSRNDRRGAYEFLGGLLRSGNAKFERDDGAGYGTNQAALDSFEEARQLLATWGNRGSHSPDVTRPEAERLIDVCESALSALTCDQCERPVHRLVDTQKGVKQCQCGKLRWKR